MDYFNGAGMILPARIFADNEEIFVKIVKGWRKISNEGGFLNETTGQTLAIVKKEFSERYHVIVFTQERTEDSQGKTISPDFQSETKAEAFAIDWMKKNPNGTN